MSLDTCTKIAGEPEDEEGVGYCPLDFYVPTTPENYYEFKDGTPYEDRVDGQFGFVVGCYWGAESYNPIYYLDLSGIQEGKFSRDSRLGDPQLGHLALKEAVSVWGYKKDYPIITVTDALRLDTRKNYDKDLEAEARKILEELKTVDPEKTEKHLENRLSEILWGDRC